MATHTAETWYYQGDGSRYLVKSEPVKPGQPLPQPSHPREKVIKITHQPNGIRWQ